MVFYKLALTLATQFTMHIKKRFGNFLKVLWQLTNVSAIAGAHFGLAHESTLIFSGKHCLPKLNVEVSTLLDALALICFKTFPGYERETFKLLHRALVCMGTAIKYFVIKTQTTLKNSDRPVLNSEK